MSHVKSFFFNSLLAIYALAAGSTHLTRAGLPERDLSQRNWIHSVDSEVIPLINCEAMYQAAVSKRADNTISSRVLCLVHGHALFHIDTT